MAVLTVGWVLTLIHICTSEKVNSAFKRIPPVATSVGEDAGSLTCHYRHHTLLLVGVWSPGPLAVAVEGSFGVDALTVSTQRFVVAFVHI